MVGSESLWFRIGLAHHFHAKDRSSGEGYSLDKVREAAPASLQEELESSRVWLAVVAHSATYLTATSGPKADRPNFAPPPEIRTSTF